MNDEIIDILRTTKIIKGKRQSKKKIQHKTHKPNLNLIPTQYKLLHNITRINVGFVI